MTHCAPPMMFQRWVVKDVFPSEFRPTPACKPVSRAEVGIETGFHAGVGRNADGNNL